MPDGTMRWELVERGRYIATAPWGATVELERRRAEGGEPGGWFLFAELPSGGCLAGHWCGAYRDDAMASAADWIATNDRQVS
jgi:hypothetical protein